MQMPVVMLFLFRWKFYFNVNEESIILIRQLDLNVNIGNSLTF